VQKVLRTNQLHKNVFGTNGIETQIITRVFFKLEAELASFANTVSQLQEEDHLRLRRTEKEVPT